MQTYKDRIRELEEERDAEKVIADKYRELMAVRKRAGWKGGHPCACVFDWDSDKLLHECEEHRVRRENLEDERDIFARTLDKRDEENKRLREDGEC